MGVMAKLAVALSLLAATSNEADDLSSYVVSQVRAELGLEGKDIELEIQAERSGLPLTSEHPVATMIPRYHRMVVFDENTNQYQILKAKVDKPVREHKVVETRTQFNVTIAMHDDSNAASAGDTPEKTVTTTVFAECARDRNGYLALTKLYGEGLARIGEKLDGTVRNTKADASPECGDDNNDGDNDGDDDVAGDCDVGGDYRPPLSTTTGLLSVMSANIWNFNHWRLRMPLLRSIFQRLDVSIIGFQEVRSIKHPSQNFASALGRSQVSDLRTLLPGYHFVSEAAMLFDQEEELHQEGLAIFSRYPIIDTSFLKLSRDPHDHGDFHQRIVLRALVQVPGFGEVNVFVTHLSLSLQARVRTLEEIGRFVNSFQGPKVVVGDFNAVLEDEDPEYASRHGLTDVWRELYPSDDGFTFNSWDHKSRIDYVLSQNLEPTRMWVEGVEAVNIPDGSMDGLDHYKLSGKLFPSDHMLPVATFKAIPQEDAH